MKITSCTIVGAMVAPRGKAPFDRANVVVASRVEPDRFLQVSAYIGSDELDGKPLALDEWRALVWSEQAIEIDPVAAAPGAAFWVLRPTFEGRDAALEEVKSSGLLLRLPSTVADGSFGCLVRESDPAANALRDRWADEAFAQAKSWAHDGHWERARDSATRAFVVERAMTAERIAMLALATDRCGNTTRALGYLQMARNSRGADFLAQVHEKRADLERQLDEALPRSERRPRFAAAISAANDNGLRGGLERVKRNRRSAHA